ncbi:hypothetical protein AOLI_G00153630 [Acnodon oligacanthus]
MWNGSGCGCGCGAVPSSGSPPAAPGQPRVSVPFGREALRGACERRWARSNPRWLPRSAHSRLRSRLGSRGLRACSPGLQTGLCESLCTPGPMASLQLEIQPAEGRSEESGRSSESTETLAPPVRASVSACCCRVPKGNLTVFGGRVLDSV